MARVWRGWGAPSNLSCLSNSLIESIAYLPGAIYSVLISKHVLEEMPLG